MKSRQFRYYDLLVHIFVVLLLISNLVGQKITAFGPIRVSGAPVEFLDILQELIRHLLLVHRIRESHFWRTRSSAWRNAGFG